MALKFDASGKRITGVPEPLKLVQEQHVIGSFKPFNYHSEMERLAGEYLEVIDEYFRSNYPSKYRSKPSVVFDYGSKRCFYNIPGKFIHIGMASEYWRTHLRMILVHEYLHHLGYHHDSYCRSFKSNCKRDQFGPLFESKIFGSITNPNF